jgi:hypothetical protein
MIDNYIGYISVHLKKQIMKKNEKLITGLAAGAAVLALFLIPKTRRMLTDAACAISGKVKNAVSKAGDTVAAHA